MFHGDLLFPGAQILSKKQIDTYVLLLKVSHNVVLSMRQNTQGWGRIGIGNHNLLDKLTTEDVS